VKKFRQRYYDLFSRFYDQFVAFHSRDDQQKSRGFLTEHTGVEQGDRALDICAGTGSTLSHLQKRVGRDGLVVGVDFSRGMLTVAQVKTVGYHNVFLVEADVAYLPFKKSIFDAVTCSFAFYELKGESHEHCLHEIGRVLNIGKPFLMMEHDVPKACLIRMLYYLRLLSMGPKKALEILRHEKELLAGYFRYVDEIKAPSGRTKIMICKDYKN
jgi:ubiquinone/menaquinone biosynthesis C-methylase UbiE